MRCVGARRRAPPGSEADGNSEKAAWVAGQPFVHVHGLITPPRPAKGRAKRVCRKLLKSGSRQGRLAQAAAICLGIERLVWLMRLPSPAAI
jgi:hypothetical protein